MPDVKISALTEKTTPVPADSIPMYDLAGNATKRSTVNNILKSVSGVTEDTTPDVADSLLTYDNSASLPKRVTLANFFKVVNTLTQKTTPVSADKMPIYDVAGTAGKYITLGDFIDKVGIVADTTPQLGGPLDLNDKYFYETITVGETVADKDLLYFKVADGKYWKADADAAATATTKLVIAIGAISADATGTGLVRGKYTTTGLTAGLNYVSTTAAAVTATPPSGTADIVRIVGNALSTTVMDFNPDQGWLEIV